MIKVIIDIVYVTFDTLLELAESALYVGRTLEPEDRKKQHVKKFTKHFNKEWLSNTSQNVCCIKYATKWNLWIIVDKCCKKV